MYYYNLYIFIYVLFLTELINCKLVCENKNMYETINLTFNFTKFLCNKKKYSKDYVIKGGGCSQMMISDYLGEGRGSKWPKTG